MNGECSNYLHSVIWCFVTRFHYLDTIAMLCLQQQNICFQINVFIVFHIEIRYANKETFNYHLKNRD